MATRIKGASLINTIGILREVLGMNRFQEIVALCPPPTQNLIRRTLIAVEWIAIEQWAPFVELIFEHICRRDEHQFRRLMRAVCKRDFSTLYRSYIAQASPQTILERSSAIWSSYFDSGSLSLAADILTQDPQQRTLELRGLETTSLVFAMIMHAYLEQLMLMTGAQNCTIQRTRERHSDGRFSCDYLISLSAGPKGIGEVSQTRSG